MKKLIPYDLIVHVTFKDEKITAFVIPMECWYNIKNTGKSKSFSSELDHSTITLFDRANVKFDNWDKNSGEIQLLKVIDPMNVRRPVDVMGLLGKGGFMINNGFSEYVENMLNPVIDTTEMPVNTSSTMDMENIEVENVVDHVKETHKCGCNSCGCEKKKPKTFKDKVKDFFKELKNSITTPPTKGTPKLDKVPNPPSKKEKKEYFLDEHTK